jgi:DNA-binding CsgD family transcriptional regulator
MNFEHPIADGSSILADGQTVFFGTVFGARIHDASFVVRQDNHILSPTATKVVLLGALGLSRAEIGQQMDSNEKGIAYIRERVLEKYRITHRLPRDTHTNIAQTVGWLFRERVFVPAEHTSLIKNLTHLSQRQTAAGIALNVDGSIFNNDRNQHHRIQGLRRTLYVRETASLALLWHLSDWRIDTLDNNATT